MAESSVTGTRRVQDNQAHDRSIKLGSGVYLYKPKPYTHSDENPQLQSNSSSSPDLIILCSWMGAATKHIAKYITEYTQRYPQTRLLLIRSSIMDLTLKPVRWQIQNMLEAVKLIKSMADNHSQNGKKLHVLMHNFSNGGNWSATILAQAYKARTSTQLPISALVSDSAPSLPDAKAAVNAMSQALGKSVLLRLVGLTAIWTMIIVTYIINRLRITENTLYKIRRLLNDPTGPFLREKVPRLYICSRTDAMVPMNDVVLHASQARTILSKRGVENVDGLIQVEEFQKSQHVSHMMVDKDRYWRIIDEVWKRAD